MTGATITMRETLDNCELCVFASNNEETRPSSHCQVDWNHRGRSRVDRHGALSVRRGLCQPLLVEVSKEMLL